MQYGLRMDDMIDDISHFLLFFFKQNQIPIQINFDLLEHVHMMIV